jgi:adenosyl cobinamide kinase/adenosyl cobinamide phosphate guanylyltransferase
MGMVLLTGGARSGKSEHATRLAEESGMPVTFIATATAGDEEMAERIRLHRAGRPAAWKTVDAPLELAQAVTAAPAGDFLVVDCLTLWVANLLGAGRAAHELVRLGTEAAGLLAVRHAAVVTNEVGMGIVPDSALARTYRDALGAVNAQFAKRSTRVLLMVAGMAVELHPA